MAPAFPCFVLVNTRMAHTHGTHVWHTPVRQGLPLCCPPSRGSSSSPVSVLLSFPRLLVKPSLHLLLVEPPSLRSVAPLLLEAPRQALAPALLPAAPCRAPVPVLGSSRSSSSAPSCGSSSGPVRVAPLLRSFPRFFVVRATATAPARAAAASAAARLRDPDGDPVHHAGPGHRPPPAQARGGVPKPAAGPPTRWRPLCRLAGSRHDPVRPTPRSR